MPEGTTPSTTDAARQRLALAQTSLLSTLVAGTPAPEGFDRSRIAVQRRALLAKRAGVVARVAPELPEILGEDFRPAFLAYARGRPMATEGYRRDALTFVEWLTSESAEGPGSAPALDDTAREALTAWWRERAGPAPLPPAGRVQVLGRAVVRFMRSSTDGARAAFSHPGPGLVRRGVRARRRGPREAPQPTRR